MSVYSRQLWRVGDRTPPVIFISYTNVLRQNEYASAGELPFLFNFCSFFVANDLSQVLN